MSLSQDGPLHHEIALHLLSRPTQRASPLVFHDNHDFALEPNGVLTGLCIGGSHC